MKFDISHLLKGRLWIFSISFFIVFITVSLKHLGIEPLRLVLPITTSKIDSLSSIRPLLEKKKSTYSLTTPNEFIARSYADETASYNEARAYVVVDFETGKVVMQKNLSSRYPMASLTKIMTGIVALDLATIDEVFTVTQKAQDQIPTHIALKKSQRLTLEELLYASLLTSANDAAQVIMDGIDQKYGDKIFIRSMNAKAEFLGLENTHFKNPQGFDDSEHYSSVEDLAKLSHYALKMYPEIAKMVAIESYVLPKTKTHESIYLNNWNGLLGVYPSVSGLKIGNTGNAKKTTIVVAEREGKKMVVVLLGAPGVFERDLWAAELLDTGFKTEYGLEPVNVTKDKLLAKYATWKY